MWIEDDDPHTIHMWIKCGDPHVDQELDRYAIYLEIEDLMWIKCGSNVDKNVDQSVDQMWII